MFLGGTSEEHAEGFRLAIKHADAALVKAQRNLIAGNCADANHRGGADAAFALGRAHAELRGVAGPQPGANWGILLAAEERQRAFEKLLSQRCPFAPQANFSGVSKVVSQERDRSAREAYERTGSLIAAGKAAGITPSAAWKRLFKLGVDPQRVTATKGKLETVREVYLRTGSLTQAAEAAGAGMSTAHRWLKSMGLTRAVRGGKCPEGFETRKQAAVRIGHDPTHLDRIISYWFRPVEIIEKPRRCYKVNDVSQATRAWRDRLTRQAEAAKRKRALNERRRAERIAAQEAATLARREAGQRHPWARIFRSRG